MRESNQAPASPASSPFAEALDIHAILTSKPQPLDQVLPGLLAGTVGMLAGPGGIGKTMLELQVAVAMATGTPACGALYRFSAPAPVVLVAAEEDARVLSYRLHAIAHTLFSQSARFAVTISYEEFLARLQANLRLFAGTSQGLTLLNREWSHTPRVKELAEAAQKARLVMVDPLRQFHACDENDSGAMNEVILALRHVAAQSGAAVVFAHHATKAATSAGQGDVAGAARGSSALTDGVRWQLNLSRPSKEQAQRMGIAEDSRGRYLQLDLAKSNYAPPQDTIVLERLPGGVLAVHAQQAKPKGRGSRAGNPEGRQLSLAGGR